MYTTHTPYVAPQVYERYYVNQVGSGIPVYRGSTSLQRGYGLGGLLGGLFRSALPLLKKGASAVGKEALKTGVGIAQDVLSGQNIKTAAKRRVKTAGRNMGTKVLNKIQKGKGAVSKPKPGKRGKKRGPSNSSVISKASKRRRNTYNDIFG